jgi:hypothetical protein
MKKMLAYLFCLASMAGLAQLKARVHVTYTNSYCGGARPTPEIEQQARTPLEFTNVALLLAGKTKVKVKTDSTASFVAALRPGKYKVRLAKANTGSHTTNFDGSCTRMAKASFGELIVTKGVYEYELNLHFPCNPCLPPRE